MPKKTLKQSFEKRLLSAMKRKNPKATMKNVRKRLDMLLKSVGEKGSKLDV